MDGWDVSLDSFWSAAALYDPVYPPNHPNASRAAVAALCSHSGGCVMYMSAGINLAGINLTGSNDPMLQFYRYVHPSLDAGNSSK